MPSTTPPQPVDGRHVCGIAPTAEAHAAAAVRWVTDGLDAGMKVVWAEPASGQLTAWLDRAGVAWEPAVDRGQLLIADPADLIGVAGDEDFAPRAAAAIAMARGSLDEGYTGLAVGVECTDALAVMPDVATQTRFEAVWEELTRVEPLWLLCLMGPSVPPAQVLGSVANHPRELDAPLAGARITGGEVRLRGEVDLSNADLVTRFLGAAAADPALADDVVRVDAAALAFADVAGVRALAGLAGAVAPRRVQVTDAPASLRRVVELAGWGGLLDLEPRVTPA